MRMLVELELFSAVAELQNFGRAAARLGMTPSTLTRRIAALERDLGVTLILRSTRSFTLTEPGKKLQRHAQTVLSEAVRLRNELSADAGIVTGHLRVGAPADLVCTILMPALSQYCLDNETASIAITATQDQPDLTRDSLDVAFAVAHQTRLPDSSHATHLIGSFPRMPYASKSYLKQRGTPTQPRELGQHACIRYLDETVETHWELVRAKRQQTVRVDGPCSCSSVVACAQAARGNLGIAMLPQYMATHPSFGGGLVRVLPEWQGTAAQVLAITPDRVISAKTREVIRLVHSGFQARLEDLETSRS